MKKGKADTLALYLNESMAVFTGIQNQLAEDKKVMDDRKRKFCEANFILLYADFEEELRHNILEYRNLSIVYDYIVSCLGDFQALQEFIRVTNRIIIQSGNDVSFLLKLKLSIEDILDRIAKLSACNYHGNPKAELSRFYEATLKDYATGDDNRTTPTKATIGQPYNPFYDEWQDFELLKAEIDGIADAGERLYIVRRWMYDIRQWQVLNDHDGNEPFGKSRTPVSETYFEKMNRLCSIEMERIEKEMEHERNAAIYQHNRQALTGKNRLPDTPGFNWNGTDTDLLELSVALLKTNTITRKDGKRMTQKELKEAFEKMFGMEIKDAKAKLSNAVQRKKSLAPFLESLATAFEEYTKERA